MGGLHLHQFRHDLHRQRRPLLGIEQHDQRKYDGTQQHRGLSTVHGHSRHRPGNIVDTTAHPASRQARTTAGGVPADQLGVCIAYGRVLLANLPVRQGAGGRQCHRAVSVFRDSADIPFQQTVAPGHSQRIVHRHRANRETLDADLLCKVQFAQ